jgi:hypothetical protein
MNHQNWREIGRFARLISGGCALCAGSDQKARRRTFCGRVGMGGIGKAEHDVVAVIAPEGMTARAERQVPAEFMLDHVVTSGARIGGQRNLVRPAAVDALAREFAFAPHHGVKRTSREHCSKSYEKYWRLGAYNCA